MKNWNTLLKKKIPNIIFHGESGSANEQSYMNLYPKYTKMMLKMKEFTMFVECAHGKGIKFIREELKFFAKTKLIKEGGVFKALYKCR